MRGDVLFPVFVQAWRACVTRPTRRSREPDYMQVDQISSTHRRERQGMKVVSNHLANPYGTGDRRGQRSVLSLLAPQCRVVFFQLHIGRALLARPNSYTALNNLGPETI